MNTYIFSNCAKSTPAEYGKHLVDTIPLDARLILLNRGNMYYRVREFKKYTNQNFILRDCHVRGTTSFFGLQDLVLSGWTKYINDIVLFEPNKDEASAEITMLKKDETIMRKRVNTPWMLDYASKTGGKQATTGFSAYHIVQNIYGVAPKDIVLVNFYGNEDNSTCKHASHDWSFEDTWLKDKNRIFI